MATFKAKKPLKTKSAKKKLSKDIPTDAAASSAIPKDLADKWGAVEAVATTFTCLQHGMFTHSYMNAVKASLQFVAKLHEQTVEDALKHPQSDLIPELKALKDGKAAPDGEAQNQSV